MGWVILFIVLLAAALGVLGAVLKIAAAVILGLILVVVILTTIAWFGFKRWARDLQVRSQTMGTDAGSYEVTGWIRTEDGKGSPDPGQPPPALPGDEP